jgi:hypothetical protein
MKTYAIVNDGGTVRLVKCKRKGRKITDPKTRRSWAIRTSPRTFKDYLGSPTAFFFASCETGTTYDPPTEKGTVKVDGRDMLVTPELIHELSSSEDLQAFNLSQGIPWLLVWLSGGTGAALMVVVYLAFSSFGSFG